MLHFLHIYVGKKLQMFFNIREYNLNRIIYNYEKKKIFLENTDFDINSLRINKVFKKIIFRLPPLIIGNFLV